MSRSTGHNASRRGRGADVRFPPPLIFAGAIIAGLMMNRVIPLGVLPPSAAIVRRMLGWGLIALSAVLASWAAILFARAKTSLLPIRPTTALVHTGPFRFTRNPMYLGMSGLVAAVALLANNMWMLGGVVAAIGVTNRLVISREERYLESIFGDAYRRYEASVPRWL